MTIEGVDYSRTPHAGSPSVAALTAAGKHFVGRYAVNDKSPNGRGITAEEYQRMRAGGIDVFLYWESHEAWMLDGFPAGVVAAVNAENNIREAGMPVNIPVYFACDFDAAPGDQAAIDECLRGCASVLGADRVGLYAGYFPLLRAMQNGSAKWLCQTLAWSGGNLLPQAHLYQYDTQGNYIDGTDVDLVRAYTDNYGQASKFEVPPEPTHPVPDPIWWEPGDIGVQKRESDGALALAMIGEVTASRTVPIRKSAHSKAQIIERWTIGTKGKIVGTHKAANRQRWVFVEVAPGQYGRALWSAFHERFPTL